MKHFLRNQILLSFKSLHNNLLMSPANIIMFSKLLHHSFFLNSMKKKNSYKPYSVNYLVSLQRYSLLLTTRLPMTTVAKKNGIHVGSPTSKQSHMDSIHSPHNTRNTIMNECKKSVKFHLGSSWSLNKCIFSVKWKTGICILRFSTR